MCDYSLHAVASRPAKVGDKLITTDFHDTLTRGFTAIGEPDVAVCLRPGTELAFEEEVERHYMFLQTLFFSKSRWKIGHKAGVFRQINIDNPGTHHDAIEFPDGQTVLVTRLRAGQRATVLQLPVRPLATPDGRMRARTTVRSAFP
jgi:hypothetical protein